MKYAMLLALVLGSALTHAEDMDSRSPQPDPVVAGQTWTFKQVLKTPAGVTESRTIFRVAPAAGDRLQVESMPAQLNGRPTVWRKRQPIDNDSCMVDFFGTGSLGITDSCATTFTPGMDWTTENVIKGVRVMQRYQVLDTEMMTVAAGAFQTVKIEAFWEAGKGKARAGKPTHHVTYWYAPETRAMVKVHREYLNASGAVESESTEELERYRPNIAR